GDIGERPAQVVLVIVFAARENTPGKTEGITGERRPYEREGRQLEYRKGRRRRNARSEGRPDIVLAIEGVRRVPEQLRRDRGLPAQGRQVDAGIRQAGGRLARQGVRGQDGRA